MTSNTLTVGLGEIKVSLNPNDILVAYGLGSCVGIGMYDPAAKVGGLLHAVLPERADGAKNQSPKYVTSGIEILLEAMEDAGASRGRLRVYMAGGANMLIAPGFSSVLNIGDRNVEIARETLEGHKLKILDEEVGGHIGRTVKLYVDDGRMTLRMMGNKERKLGEPIP